MVEMSVCIPMFRSKYIAWLLFESIIRQKNINFPWELIIIEENNNESFGQKEILKYREKLENIGCVDLKYYSINQWIPLGLKTLQLIQYCNINSKIVTFAATDFYLPPTSFSSQYDSLISEKYDIYRSAKTIFYNIENEKISLYDTSKKEYHGDSSERGIQLKIAKQISGLKKLGRGIDKQIYLELLRITNNNLKVYENKSDSWKYGFSTHGLNNLSGSIRSKRISENLISKNYYPVNYKLEDYIPKEIVKRLKDSKQYIHFHSNELNRMIKELDKTQRINKLKKKGIIKNEENTTV